YDIIGTAYSNNSFAYSLPVVHGLKPHFGPLSGGTNVTIFGQHLNVGGKREVKLNGVNCTVVEIDNDGIICKSGSNTFHSGNDIVVFIDNHAISSNLTFTYMSDPVFLGVDGLTSIERGGMNVTVKGRNLNHVASPTMVVRFFSPQKEEIARLESPCIVQNNGIEMKCKTPKLPKHLRPDRKDTAIQSSASFSMDGAPEFNVIGVNNSDSVTLLYFADPVFKAEDEVQQVNLNDRVLVIHGEHLSNKYQVKV
ncbi:hepatocyte growth factor receptor-like protein, partial [Leptotrombidium deliense]